LLMHDYALFMALQELAVDYIKSSGKKRSSIC
jgi:hypothetical protein